MSRIADVDLTDIPRRGRKPKYPWPLWFDGRTHILVQGEDYAATSPASFRSTVYSAASRHGVEIETRIMPVAGWEDDETPHLHVQATTPMKMNGEKKQIKRRARSST